MSIFGERLKKLRDREGASQKTIAQIVGKSREAMSKYEIGDREPDLVIVAALAKHFKVSSDYMLGLTDNSAFSVDFAHTEEFEKYRPYFSDGRFKKFLKTIVKAIDNDIDWEVVDELVNSLISSKKSLRKKERETP